MDYNKLLDNEELQTKLKISLAIRRLTNMNININNIQHYIYLLEDNHTGFQNNLDYIMKFKNDEWNSFCSFVGILSLCKNERSRRMWCKYSGNLTGVCYVFDSQSLKRDIENLEYEYSYYDVEYNKVIRKLSVISSNDEKIFNRYSFKYNNYKFEEEFRICLKKQEISDLDRKVNFSITTLKRIIIGHKMSFKNFNLLVNELKKKDPKGKVHLFRTELIDFNLVGLVCIKDYSYWN